MMRNPIQEYETARGMTIPALVAVMNGQSDMVDLAVAHSVLRDKVKAEIAKKGAMAQQMPQQKIRDRDIAMASGLGGAPADVNVPMGGIVGTDGAMSQTAAGGGSVVAFQSGGLGALNMSGNEIKSFIDQMVKKGVPPAQINQFAQQAQAIAATNPGALKGFLGTAARTFFGAAAPMIGFTDALIASERGGRAATGATPGYDYAPEEMMSGVEPGVVGPSTNKSTIEQLFSNIGAIMPSGPSAQTREANAIQQRLAAANFGQADTGGAPTQTIAEFEAAQKKKQEETAAESAAGAGGPGGGPSGIAAVAASQARVKEPTGYADLMKNAEEFIKANTDVKTNESGKKTLQQFTKDEMDALREAGYDFNLVSDNIRQLAKEKEELAGDKKEAQSLRLIEAGLGILGGESPYAFVNIGKGATPALQGLAKDLKEIKKNRRELDKEALQLKLLQNQITEGTVKNARARLDKQEERYERRLEQENKLKFDVFRTMASDETQRYVADTSRQTSLDVANIQTSRVGETMQIIQGMSGATLDEKVKNYFNAAKGDPKERAKIEALYKLATDPTEMNRIKRSDPALYEQLKTLLQGGLASAGMITEKPSTGTIRN